MNPWPWKRTPKVWTRIFISLLVIQITRISPFAVFLWLSLRNLLILCMVHVPHCHSAACWCMPDMINLIRVQENLHADFAAEPEKEPLNPLVAERTNSSDCNASLAVSDQIKQSFLCFYSGGWRGWDLNRCSATVWFLILAFIRLNAINTFTGGCKYELRRSRVAYTDPAGTVWYNPGLRWSRALSYMKIISPFHFIGNAVVDSLWPGVLYKSPILPGEVGL